MTTGAIYGNFKNRDELFISLGQTYWAPIKPHVQRNSTFPEIMRALADATLAAIPDRSTAAVGRLTGLAYTLTHEELRAKVAEFTAQSYALGEQWLRSVTKEEELPMPANQLVRVIHALTEGLVFQRLLTPELMPDEIFHAAFAALGKKTQKD
jgi:AcrR family transcriptional regulator